MHDIHGHKASMWSSCTVFLCDLRISLSWPTCESRFHGPQSPLDEASKMMRSAYQLQHPNMYIYIYIYIYIHIIYTISYIYRISYIYIQYNIYSIKMYYIYIHTISYIFTICCIQYYIYNRYTGQQKCNNSRRKEY